MLSLGAQKEAGVVEEVTAGWKVYDSTTKVWSEQAGVRVVRYAAGGMAIIASFTSFSASLITRSRFSSLLNFLMRMCLSQAVSSSGVSKKICSAVQDSGATGSNASTVVEEESQQELDDIAAAVAQSLALSQAASPSLPPSSAHPVTRVKRWGDGLEAPAAGSRHFYPPGFMVTRDVSEAIEAFGHSPAEISQIMDAGRAKAATASTPLTAKLAAAIYAYTQDSPLYMMLTFTMRTPHTSLTPTDTELKQYADFIVHAERALSCLPAHVSEFPGHGMVYRGIRVLLNPALYAPGQRVTWQGFSSSTRKQLATLDFVDRLPGRKLQGSIFVDR